MLWNDDTEVPFVITWNVIINTARAQWNSLLKMTSLILITLIQYSRIPCVIRTVVTVHVCCRFENHSSCSSRLRLVTGVTDRTKETRKLRIQENEIGNETFSATYFCNGTTKCCYCCCHLHRKYTTRLERRHPAALGRRQAQQMAEMCNDIWNIFGNLMEKNHIISYSYSEFLLVF